jgi:hypothetical protein
MTDDLSKGGVSQPGQPKTIARTSKRKKAVTPRVLAANRDSAKNSPGPNDTTNTRFNAYKLGILARNIVFRDEGQRKSFDNHRLELIKYHRPVGPSERDAVEEMALCTLRQSLVYGWEFDELSKRPKASEAILNSIVDQDEAYEVVRQASAQGYQVEELVFRDSSRDKQDPDGLGEVLDKVKQGCVETKMVNSLSLILRYGAAIRRDYSQALGRLLTLQRERLEREELEQEVENEG